MEPAATGSALHCGDTNTNGLGDTNNCPDFHSDADANQLANRHPDAHGNANAYANWYSHVDAYYDRDINLNHRAESHSYNCASQHRLG